MLDPASIIDKELSRSTRNNRAAKAHKTYILNARKVVDFLRENPGSTNAEIRETTGHSPMRLQRLKMARWKREGGKARWYLVSDIARPPKEEVNEETEIRWVKYTNTP